jgi:hypothetical protein
MQFGSKKGYSFAGTKKWGVKTNEQSMVIQVLHLNKLLVCQVYHEHLESDSPKLAFSDGPIVPPHLKEVNVLIVVHR